MLHRIRDEWKREIVDKLLFIAERGALAVEKVPHGLHALGRGRQLLGQLPAAEVDVQAEVDLDVGGGVVHVRDQAGVVPHLNAIEA